MCSSGRAVTIGVPSPPREGRNTMIPRSPSSAAALSVSSLESTCSHAGFSQW